MFKRNQLRELRDSVTHATDDRCMSSFEKISKKIFISIHKGDRCTVCSAEQARWSKLFTDIFGVY